MIWKGKLVKAMLPFYWWPACSSEQSSHK